MNKSKLFASLIVFLAANLLANAQRVLSLDSCRALAISNNKGIKIANEKIKKSRFERKAARTNYLPNFSATGTYMYNSRSIQLLSDENQAKFSNLGTTLHSAVQGKMAGLAQSNPMVELISPLLGALDMSELGNAFGQGIVDAFATNTHHVWAGAISVTEPLYAGGKITAYNKITELSEQLSQSQLNTTTDELIQNTDLVYWQVVSLKNKMALAKSYVDVLTKLENDVTRMKEEGVATSSDLLSIGVKVNQAQTDMLRAENGYELSKMLLCQICGIDINSDITLQDENMENLTIDCADYDMNYETAKANRPEIRSLKIANDIYAQKVKVVRSEHLPTVALAGNYIISNPSVFNGFERKFKGMFNVGVVVNVPIYHFNEGSYKVNAAKAEANISKLTLDEVEEKIELQVNQCTKKSQEAKKRLAMAEKNMNKATENLRCANLGFQEGVITISNVMEAQTAWLNANTEKIDAQIDVKMADVNLKKSMGILR
ncbi:MAG: TolC family protein [Bacteroidaceae bacterium]|nr:TolC family protein [Bacteroidaceae bacterium]